MTNKNKAEVVFNEELKYIKSPPILSFTLRCFEELTPDYFWDFTASSTQKNHPRISNKKHGLVIHTKLCVWWGRKLADSFNIKNLDIIVSSLLLHDLQKFGRTLDKDGKPTLACYSESHGPLLASQMENIYSSMNINENLIEDINLIVTCVALHMGRWTNKSLSLSWTEFPNKGEYQEIIDRAYQEIIDVVHLADYCASRKIDNKIDELDKYEFPYLE